MIKTYAAALAFTSLLTVTVRSASFADSILSYNPGSGFATDFSSGRGLTNAAAALGEPSRSTPGTFGGPVDPFNPPYLNEQIVSVGAGGSLTVRLGAPILNLPSNRFGLDFTIFGNSGFVITNGNFSGGGITDGSLFGASSGSAIVSVSADNVTYFQLNPARSAPFDTLFPTDGGGSFDLPVDPTLVAADFAGRGLAGIRELYQGSAGGTGFDLAWAQDAAGQSVSLPEAQYVRITMLSGAAEIDGLAGVGAVPSRRCGQCYRWGWGRLLARAGTRPGSSPERPGLL